MSETTTIWWKNAALKPCMRKKNWSLAWDHWFCAWDAQCKYTNTISDYFDTWYLKLLFENPPDSCSFKWNQIAQCTYHVYNWFLIKRNQSQNSKCNLIAVNFVQIPIMGLVCIKSRVWICRLWVTLSPPSPLSSRQCVQQLFTNQITF